MMFLDFQKLINLQQCAFLPIVGKYISFHWLYECLYLDFFYISIIFKVFICCHIIILEISILPLKYITLIENLIYT